MGENTYCLGLLFRSRATSPLQLSIYGNHGNFVIKIFQNTHLAMNNNFKYLLKMDWADTVDHENKETDQHGKFPQLQV